MFYRKSCGATTIVDTLVAIEYVQYEINDTNETGW